MYLLEQVVAIEERNISSLSPPWACQILLSPTPLADGTTNQLQTSADRLFLLPVTDIPQLKSLPPKWRGLKQSCDFITGRAVGVVHAPLSRLWLKARYSTASSYLQWCTKALHVKIQLGSSRLENKTKATSPQPLFSLSVKLTSLGILLTNTSWPPKMVHRKCQTLFTKFSQGVEVNLFHLNKQHPLMLTYITSF